MTTVDDSIRNQNESGVLPTPTDPTSTSTSTNGPFAPSITPVSASGTPPTMKIALQNNTTSNKLYAYITGLDINKNNAVWLLRSDGVSPYYPENPSTDLSPLAANVSIQVGGPGSVRTVTIPQVAGARIWYCQDAELTFRLNRGARGPALVEPSVSNPTDPNYSLRWAFSEFTFNSFQLFANISYVDFVSIPVAMRLTSTDGTPVQTVAGMPSNGLDLVCEALQAQQKVDCAGWDQLVVQVSSPSAGTKFLRALSPNNGLVLNNKLFRNYFDAYVDQVWSHYKSTPITVDTQAHWGTVTGQVDSSGGLTFPGVGTFPKPSTADIFSCSTGAFAPYAINTAEMGNLTARLSAAFNRSTMLTSARQPSGPPSSYYQNPVTNHYSRIVHATNLDGRGYAFPYDDVAPNGGVDQSGAVSSGAPDVLTIYIGGGGAGGPAVASNATRSNPSACATWPVVVASSEMALQQQATMAPFLNLAAPDVNVDEKMLLQARDHAAEAAVDQEKGLQQQLLTSTKNGLPPTPAATAAPDLSKRFALLLHQALVYLWAAICGMGRSVWALVPRRIAQPVGAFCSRVASSPAVTAVSASMSSFVSSVVKSAAASAVAAMLIRPLVVRAVLTAAVVLITYAATAGGSAGASPMVASAVATMTGWAEELTGSRAAPLS
ncbi:glucanase b [Sporothrix brasiliensis 5110]|uniref:Glucanase b n=1 Tax=Sporothrix brasiliensis 5110 TaxID=1398154 RepID=A0A0C2IMF4_9PEZI|nr:glucanase b [Sporothrix brasiliensis 5110]KIH90216.1 glucanase b [Sporothrix brasiliensis 5110]